MTAFDQAWALLKMPYYHGTSSKNIPSIMQHGLTPHAHDEGNYANDFSYMEEDETPYEGESRAFMAPNPRRALRFATANLEPHMDIGEMTPDSHPVVIEIADDVEGLKGFQFNPSYHDFSVLENIPPEMLKVAFTGSQNYPDVDALYEDQDEDPDIARNIHDRMAIDFDERVMDEFLASDFWQRYMGMGMARHPPYVLREGLY
jgi:hypothetical protein